MAFYNFTPDDIVNISISALPKASLELNGNIVTGSVYLERPYLNAALRDRVFMGFSQKEGGFIEKTGSMSASVDFKTATSGGTNQSLWSSVVNVTYPFYRIFNENYAANYTGSLSTTIRVIDIPQVFYDKEILTGSFSASDNDAAGDVRNIYDDGRGGLYSGSLSGTLVGNIFYQEGIVALTKGDLSNFGSDSSTNFKWKVSLRGTHNIPVKIFRCHAPAGELNATTNSTFYISAVSGAFKGSREVVSSSLSPYITTVGLFNKQFELVGLAKLAQPIKKTEKESIIFRLRLDF
jgi:hypothetical protein